jgi:hypothetical protein
MGPLANTVKKEKNTQAIKYHECFDFGHTETIFLNHLMSKRKVMYAYLKQGKDCAHE